MQRAILIGLRLKQARRADFQQSMEELTGLSRSCGALPAASIVQERESIDPGTYLGHGKVAEIAAACAAERADIVIVNDPLTPAQTRNLQDSLDCKVVDRTQLILDIFAQRARTQEGKLQVELAQLNYLLPRLTGKGVELSRLGGGIGTRGPGEMKLEVDRRRIRERIHRLGRAIDRVRKTRELHRRRRERQRIPSVALVGYTNAGKSTLFEALTHCVAFRSNKLFSTLDPLCRPVRLPHGGSCYMSDTVGFIRKLPVELVAAFRATLEEVSSSDLLVHVCDISSEDPDGDIRAVESVLSEIGAIDKPVLMVYNKVDVLPGFQPPRGLGGARYVSALTGKGIEELLESIEAKLDLAPRTAKASAMAVTE